MDGSQILALLRRFSAADCADDADGPHSRAAEQRMQFRCGPSASSAQSAAQNLVAALPRCEQSCRQMNHESIFNSHLWFKHYNPRYWRLE